jgi:hypothetical protein
MGLRVGDFEVHASSAAATNITVIHFTTFSVSALLRGFCGARRLRSFCYA